MANLMPGEWDWMQQGYGSPAEMPVRQPWDEQPEPQSGGFWGNIQQWLSDPRNKAQLQGFQDSMLQQSQWSRTPPVSFGNTLAQGMQAGRKAGDQYDQDQFGKLKQGLEVMSQQDKMRQAQARQLLASGQYEPGTPAYKQLLAMAYPEKYGEMLTRKPEKDPTSYREWQLAGSPGTFAQWLQQGKSGTSLYVDPETGEVTFQSGPGVGMQKPTRKGIEGDIVSALEQLDTLAMVGENFSDEYLTNQGRIRAATGAMLDRWGVGTDNPYVSFNAARDDALIGVEQFFNQYRKDITGAAAAEKELAALKKAVINTDIGPQQFKARFDRLVKMIRAGIERKSGLLERGTVQPSESDSAMNIPSLQDIDAELARRRGQGQ